MKLSNAKTMRLFPPLSMKLRKVPILFEHPIEGEIAAEEKIELGDAT
ncbi:MAG: hypothetical protein QXK94_06240 [Candidatus Jordarchaeales archaeon]